MTTLKLPGRLYVACQVNRGWRALEIVHTFDEAFAKLGNAVTALHRRNHRQAFAFQSIRAVAAPRGAFRWPFTEG